MKKTLIIALLVLIAVAGQAQKHLPEISYSKKPAVLSGRIIKDGAEAPDTIYLRCLQPYTSGMGDAIWRTAVPLDDEGKFKNSADLVKTIKEEWSDFIVSEGKGGAPTATPPTGSGKSYKSKEEIYAIKDTAERQKAISENHELFGF